MDLNCVRRPYGTARPIQTRLENFYGIVYRSCRLSSFVFVTSPSASIKNAAPLREDFTATASDPYSRLTLGELRAEVVYALPANPDALRDPRESPHRLISGRN